MHHCSKEAVKQDSELKEEHGGFFVLKVKFFVKRIQLLVLLCPLVDIVYSIFNRRQSLYHIYSEIQ